MTRFELEKWCEEFLKSIMENAQPVVQAMYRLTNDDIEEAEFVEIASGAKTYADYKGKLASFIEDYARELQLENQKSGEKGASTDAIPLTDLEALIRRWQ